MVLPPKCSWLSRWGPWWVKNGISLSVIPPQWSTWSYPSSPSWTGCTRTPRSVNWASLVVVHGAGADLPGRGDGGGRGDDGGLQHSGEGFLEQSTSKHVFKMIFQDGSVILLQPKLASGFIPHPNSVVDWFIVIVIIVIVILVVMITTTVSATDQIFHLLAWLNFCDNW